TDFVVPKARLSISSPPVPGTPITLSTLTRPIRSVVDTTPKKFAPTFPKIIDVPNKSLLGLNSEIAIFPATGPGNASKPTADTAVVNVTLRVAKELFGPKVLLELPEPNCPANPAPRTLSCVLAAPTALYTTPGNNAPSGKHALAAELLTGLGQVTIIP